MQRITPQQALAEAGRTCVDVREFPEFAAGHKEGALLAPLRELERAVAQWKRDTPLLLICRSGKRACAAATQLERLGFTDLAVLEGGITAWQEAGLPVRTLERRPWSLERQVRLVAGILVLSFTILGVTASAWFLAVTIFLGAGLTFAALTDFCGMALLLARMPWNRARLATCSK
jgi:rhodanese-related sulfurtransferase